MHPTDGRITQEVFNAIQASGQAFPHTGRDYAANRGDTVRTIADGVILVTGSGAVPDWLANRFMLVPGSAAAGNYVFIEHEGWVEYFGHLHSIDVKPGQRVARGTRIGGAGDSGNALGVHLHYEVIVEPCTTTFPWGRYHPQAQIELEDSLANGTDVKEMPLSREDLNAIQAMHDVTRTFLKDRLEESVVKLTKATQAQHDVTRLYGRDKGQAAEDVTRAYLSDKITESK